MEFITVKTGENTLFIYLKGRINSQNALQVENEIMSAVKENTLENIVLDAQELEYISSAGLRIVLRLIQKNSDVKIINASSEVYEIFEMTGFTEMMDISKAFRQLSVDGCEVIGKGANGEVYRIDPDTIIKVYLNPDSLPDIERERALARRAFVLGIPTAIPYDVVKVGNSYGSVFELLNAKSFTKLLAADPSSVDEVVKMYVDLLKKIHSTTVNPEDMPDMREIVLDWASFLKDYLVTEKWQKLYSLVEEVPVSHKMMHGDYHTKNVMLQNGEVLLIDMDTLAQGDPIFEFASIFNAFLGFSAYQKTKGVYEEINFLGLSDKLCEDFYDKAIIEYFGTDDKEKLDEITRKAAIVGYTRLMRRLIRRGGLESEEKRKEIEFYRTNIEKLVDTVDKLTF